MKKIKLVIFDLDNTLVDFKACEMHGFKYATKLSDLAFDEYMFNTFSIIDNHLWSKGSFNNEEVSNQTIPYKRFEILFKNYNINDINIERFNQLYMYGFSKAIYPYEGSEQILKYLTEKGYLIVVATNGLIKLQYPRIMNSVLSKYIDKVVVSEEVNANKPDPAIFKKILKDYDLKPSQAIMIGDSLNNDVQGAINTGIKSIWFNRLNKNTNSDIVSDYTIHSLLDIKKIL